jgi:hypothetical protein
MYAGIQQSLHIDRDSFPLCGVCIDGYNNDDFTHNINKNNSLRERVGLEVMLYTFI